VSVGLSQASGHIRWLNSSHNVGVFTIQPPDLLLVQESFIEFGHCESFKLEM